MSTAFYTGKLKANNDSYSKKESDERYIQEHQDISGKQDVLTAGDNITIENNVISATGGGSAVTPRFSVNNGNTDAEGSMDILSYSGSTLSFKVDDGTTYAPMTCTTGYSGEQFVKEELDSISTSSLSAGTYNVFAPKTGTEAYMLNNVILVQPERPLDADVNTIPVMTSNTAPKGTITMPDNGFTNTSYAYKTFRQGYNPSDGNILNCNTGSTVRLVYTYDENERPAANTYQIKYAINPFRETGAVISYIRIYQTNDDYVQVDVNSNKSFTKTFTCTDDIKSISIYMYRGTQGLVGAFQLVIPAITTEGTIWVNNGIEPIEVQARDNNAQWQPFNDVLLGTCTVDSSHNITAISNQGFNYFSTVNMHNISTVSHEDIRADIDTLTTNKQDRINSDNKLSSELLSGTIPNTLIGSEIARTAVKKILSVSNGTIPLSREYAYYMSIPDADTTYTFDTTDFNLAQDEAIDFYLTIVMSANVFNLTFPNNIVWQNNQPVDFTSTGIYTLEIIIINGIPYVFNSGKY